MNELGLPLQNTTDWVAYTAETYFLVMWEPCYVFTGVGFSQGLSLGPADGLLLSASLPGISSVCILISSSYKDTSHVGRAPTLKPLPFPKPTVHEVEGRNGPGETVGSALRLTMAMSTDKFTFLYQEQWLMACPLVSRRNCRAAL